MLRTMRRSMAATLIAALTLAVLAFPRVSAAEGRGASAQSDGSNGANEAQSKLDKKQFKDVKVSVDNSGIATLTGTVDLYEYKVDADKRVHKVKSIKGVRNDIEVAGPSVTDQELQKKLQEKLQYDRVGYGTNAFNAIGVSVQNGAVTLGGHAYSDVDKDSALALVSTFPGVKDVNDDIEVDGVDHGRPDPALRRPGCLWLSLAEQVCYRSGQADSDFGAERQCGTLRDRRFQGGQGYSLHPRQRRSRGVRREELHSSFGTAAAAGPIEEVGSNLNRKTDRPEGATLLRGSFFTRELPSVGLSLLDSVYLSPSAGPRHHPTRSPFLRSSPGLPSRIDGIRERNCTFC